jgi:hypothetical protein
LRNAIVELTPVTIAMNHIIMEYRPPKSGIWGHAPKTRDMQEIVRCSEMYTGMLLHHGEYSRYAFEIFCIDPRHEEWVLGVIARVSELIGQAPDEPDRDGPSHAMWSLDYASYLAVREFISGLSTVPLSTEAHLSLTRCNSGLLTMDGRTPLLAYAGLPGIRQVSLLKSRITYAISNAPYVSTHYVFPFGPGDRSFREVWTTINSFGYITLHPKHLKGRVFDGMTWRSDRSIRDTAMESLHMTR